MWPEAVNRNGDYERGEVDDDDDDDDGEDYENGDGDDGDDYDVDVDCAVRDNTSADDGADQCIHDNDSYEMVVMLCIN